MAKYKVVFKRSVAKDFRAIPNSDVERVLQRINRLIEDPRPIGCEKLSGQERYRVRQGVYRVIYEIKDEELVVTVVKVAHRKHVYKFK
ncbi:type II toxin-antitoxin system RelE/ParE family toxin [Idiomarina sp.]|uniref:type II toxin-antitoxin system RelE family toxin n=1 Tax=Idiomarina sp. TaxID=1874361 RepID=UPI002606EEC8|nr:type II toxin-antitoxin system RelE/ParE family toxin [Idiomarina sp.]